MALDTSLPTSGAAAVTTRIGTLRLRRAGPDDIGRFAELRRTLRGAELWRAFLAVVGVREGDRAAAAPEAVPAYELSLLSDDDLERTAEQFVDEAGGTGAEAGAAPPRRDGERSAEFVVRLLEARLEPSAPVPTTIDRFASIHEAPAADVQGRFDHVGNVLPEPSPRWEVTKQLVRQMRAGDDAVAETRKRVEEIQDLLGSRERAWSQQEVSGAQDAASRRDARAPAVPIADGAAAIESRTQVQEAPERERAFAALADSAQTNLKTVEELRRVAETLTGAIAEIDAGRRRSDGFIRRGLLVGIVALALSCALSAISLVEGFRRDRALRASQDALAGGLSGQQRDLQAEIARLREERGGLASRVEQLEAQRSAKADEAAKVAAAPKARKAVTSADTRKPARTGPARTSSASARAR